MRFCFWTKEPWCLWEVWVKEVSRRIEEEGPSAVLDPVYVPMDMLSARPSGWLVPVFMGKEA